MYTSYLQRGFTLVELIIVIAIIGTLSAIIYPNFNDARIEARNQALQVEMKELQLAIELYRAQNGVYPPAPVESETVWGLGSCVTASPGRYLSRHSQCGNNPYIGDPEAATPAPFVGEFIASLPVDEDAANDACDFRYEVATDGSWYKLTALNCHGGDIQIEATNELARCAQSCPAPDDSHHCHPDHADHGTTYAIYSVGGMCNS